MSKSNKDIEKELIQMAAEDQRAAISFFSEIEKTQDRSLKNQLFYDHYKICHERANKMIGLLNGISSKLSENLNSDALQAIGIITQHSYLEIMESILARFKSEASTNDTIRTLLPSLIDRILVLKNRRQQFGTQWAMSDKNRPYLIINENFDVTNKLRSEYGLGPIQKPVNLASKQDKHPLGIGLARAEDQKQMTNSEYERYSKYYLKSLI